MRWLVVLGVACSSDDDDGGTPADTETETDADADSDADSDADADADADSDADTDTFNPYQDPLVRALHVAADVPAQDMFGNGVPGNPPIHDLEFHQGTPYLFRPPGNAFVEFQDTDAVEPWIGLDVLLAQGSYTTFIVYGTPAERDVLVLGDSHQVPIDVARVTWVHAAPSLVPNAVVLRDVGGGADFAGGASIPYGTSVVHDEVPGPFEVWIDANASGACESGEAFAPFDRSGGELHTIVVTEDEDGALELVSYTSVGGVFLRPVDPSLCL